MKYIYFGSYPRTAVDDDDLINNLDKITTIDKQTGYLVYEGEKYESILANPYGNARFNNGKDIERGKNYYFKVEPIEWAITDEEDKYSFLFSTEIIDNKVFSKDGSNDYEHSDIRVFLDSEFLKRTFNKREINEIVNDLIDNSVSSTGYLNNHNICVDTKDSVFLISYKEVVYICKSINDQDKYLIRTALVTDYAIAKGVRHNIETKRGLWALRSPHNLYRDSIISCYDLVEYDAHDSAKLQFGLRPCIRLKK